MNSNNLIDTSDGAEKVEAQGEVQEQSTAPVTEAAEETSAADVTEEAPAAEATEEAPAAEATEEAPAAEATEEAPAAEATEEAPAAEATEEAPAAEATEEAPAAEAAPDTPAGDAPAADAAPAAAAADAGSATAQDDDDDDDEDDTTGKSFEELLDEYDKFRTYRPGDIVTGSIVSLGEQEVLVDIGARVEGTIPASELRDENEQFSAKDGDKVTVMVCRFNPDAQYIPLSFERARVSKVWDAIEEKATAETMIQGTIIEKVKGGFIVDVGVRAFLPTSQATLKPQKEYQDLLGSKMEFAILKIQRRRGNLILSRRDILQSEFEEQKTFLFEKLQEGSVLDGAVKNITDYGVFIDLGGLDGLLHITDMSWGRVTHPKDMVELGKVLKVKVLRFDAEKEKVSLGLKQCTPDPWLSVAEKYPPNATAIGKVLNLTSYGAFVELEPGVEGMIHVSELSWTKKIRNPGQVLSKNQEVSVRVLDLDSENRRVSLSLKQTEDNPWDSLAERFPVGSRVHGKVRNITEFGAFVEIEDGIDGLVHVSDFHWGERNATPSEYVKKGEEIEVVILAVDTENHKVSLGIKQLESDPWIEFTRNHKVNAVLKAPISKVADFGMFIQLAPHVEGLIRSNEIPAGKNLSDYSEGDEIQAVITRVTHRDRKVDLSIKRIDQHEERKAVLEYTRKSDKGGATMGDIMGSDLKKLLS